MYSKENELLCHCDRKKAEWYIGKGLADRISDEPLTIRLRFSHKTTDQSAGTSEFYQESKANVCVGCGATENYLR